jgi:hypothetical protein
MIRRRGKFRRGIVAFLGILEFITSQSVDTIVVGPPAKATVQRNSPLRELIRAICNLEGRNPHGERPRTECRARIPSAQRVIAFHI